MFTKGKRMWMEIGGGLCFPCGTCSWYEALIYEVTQKFRGQIQSHVHYLLWTIIPVAIHEPFHPTVNATHTCTHTCTHTHTHTHTDRQTISVFSHPLHTIHSHKHHTMQHTIIPLPFSFLPDSETWCNTKNVKPWHNWILPLANVFNTNLYIVWWAKKSFATCVEWSVESTCWLSSSTITISPGTLLLVLVHQGMFPKLQAHLLQFTGDWSTDRQAKTVIRRGNKGIKEKF